MKQKFICLGEDEDERIVVDSTWLPDIGSTELDLEAELKMRDSSLGPSCSARSSMEPQDHKHSSFSFSKQPPEQARLPPSGRSSADRLSMRRLSASSSSRASSCVGDPSPPRHVPQGRRVAVYMARARPDQLVEEMMTELQTVESMNYTIERTETPPFFRITSLRKTSNHSGTYAARRGAWCGCSIFVF